MRLKIGFLLLMISARSYSTESLSYSGRLVNTDGSPVTGPVSIKFDLSYTNAPAAIVCSKTLAGVPLTQGVFHARLDFSTADCGGTGLQAVLANTPANESVALKVTDLTNTKAYSLQALHATPFTIMANVAKTLTQMGATTGQVLTWNGSTWTPAAPTGGGGSGSGTVTTITTGTGLTGGPITTTGTIALASGGVTSTEIANATIMDADINPGAAIARSKVAAGVATHVIVNDGSGNLSSVAQLQLPQGGTGASSASAARTNLGLGSAAVADIGVNAGMVMGADAVPSCLPTQKLQMTLGPTHSWSCATDEIFSGGSISSDIDMNGHKIIDLAAPSVATDAATKGYVDTAVAGVAVTQWTNLAGGHINFAGGRVGVGNAAPSEALDVVGNANVAGAVRLKSTTTNFVELSAPAGLSATRSFVLPSTLGATGEVLTTDGSGNLTWSAASSGSKWLENSGNVYRSSGRVGIGTSAPAVELEILANVNGSTGVLAQNASSGASAAIVHQVKNDTNTTAGMFVNGSGRGDSDTGIFYSSKALRFLSNNTLNNGGSDPISFYAGGNGASNEHLRIEATGDVGVGTTSPGARLDVKGTLRLSGSTSGFVGFSPAAVAGSMTYILPNADGSSGQALTTNGAGVLSWANGGGSTSVGGDLSGTVSNAQVVAGAITYAKTNFADGDIPAAKINGLAVTLAGKEPTIAAGAASQYWRGDKTWQPLNTSAVPEGGNLYFLDSRVRAALLSGYTIGSALPISMTDTLLEAVGKLEGSVASLQSSGQWTATGGDVYRTSGNVGIGTSTPSARLTLAAGSAVAGTAPLKLTSGTKLTAPEAGAIEFDGTNLYFTTNSATRKTLTTLKTFTGTTDPAVSDDSTQGYAVGSIGVNTSSGRSFICRSDAIGAAVWEQLGASSHPGYVAGNWYVPGTSLTTGTSAAVYSASLMYCSTGIISQLVTVSALTLRITTAGTSNIQLALYKNDAALLNRPGKLVASTPSIANTAVGTVTGTFAASVNVPAGSYWFCLQVNDSATRAIAYGSGASNGVPDFSRTMGSSSANTVMGGTGSGYPTGVTTTNTFGSWPTDLNGSSWTETTSTQSPLIGFRVIAIP